MGNGMASLDDELKESMLTVFFPTFLKIILPLIVLMLVFTFLKMCVKSKLSKGWAFVVCFLLNVAFIASSIYMVLFIIKNVELPSTGKTPEVITQFFEPPGHFLEQEVFALS